MVPFCTSKTECRTPHRGRARRSAPLSALLALLLFLSFLLVSCSGAGVSSACAGYAAGQEDGGELLWRENEEILLPALFVRAYAAHCASASEERAKRVIYDGRDPLYIKLMLDECGLSPGELVARMNERASKEAPGLVFGSVSGRSDTENDLYALLGSEAPPFEGSVGTLAAVKKAAAAFAADPVCALLLGTKYTTFADGSEGSRVAPLLDPEDQFGLENAVLYLADYTSKNGEVAYLALGAVREGEKTAFAAVLEMSGDDSPVWYASCDVGNLAGQTLGKDYRLLYSDSDDREGAGMVLGASIFSGTVLVLLAAVALLLVAAAVGGIIMTARRNIAGRKKYSAPKDDGKN